MSPKGEKGYRKGDKEEAEKRKEKKEDIIK